MLSSCLPSNYLLSTLALIISFQGSGFGAHAVMLFDLAYFLSPERVQCFRRHVFSFSLPTLLILFASLAPFSFQGLGLPETLRRPREASSATGVVA